MQTRNWKAPEPCSQPRAHVCQVSHSELLGVVAKGKTSRTHPTQIESESLGLWPGHMNFVKHTPPPKVRSSPCCSLCLMLFPQRATCFPCTSRQQSATQPGSGGCRERETPGVGGKGPPLSPPHAHQPGPEGWNPPESGRLLQGGEGTESESEAKSPRLKRGCPPRPPVPAAPCGFIHAHRDPTPVLTVFPKRTTVFLISEPGTSPAIAMVRLLPVPPGPGLMSDREGRPMWSCVTSECRSQMQSSCPLTHRTLILGTEPPCCEGARGTCGGHMKCPSHWPLLRCQPTAPTRHACEGAIDNPVQPPSDHNPLRDAGENRPAEHSPAEPGEIITTSERWLVLRAWGFAARRETTSHWPDIGVQAQM